MLTRIRNAIKARHPKVDVPASRLKTEIARILKEEGYILNYKVAEEGVRKTIKIYLKYQPNNQPVISKLERVSRPGCRVYVGRDEIPRVLGGLGVNILTTPRGRDDRPGRAQSKAWAERCSARSGEVELAVETMSRVGNKPIPLPKGVKVSIGEQLQVEGPKGKLMVPIPAGSARCGRRTARWNSRATATTVCRAARADAGPGGQRRHRESRPGSPRSWTSSGSATGPTSRDAWPLSPWATRTPSRCCCPRA